MKRLRIRIVSWVGSVILALGTAGCIPVIIPLPGGRLTSGRGVIAAEDLSWLRKGETTRADVLLRFGGPFETLENPTALAYFWTVTSPHTDGGIVTIGGAIDLSPAPPPDTVHLMAFRFDPAGRLVEWEDIGLKDATSESRLMRWRREGVLRDRGRALAASLPQLVEGLSRAQVSEMPWVGAALVEYRDGLYEQRFRFHQSMAGKKAYEAWLKSNRDGAGPVLSQGEWAGQDLDVHRVLLIAFPSPLPDWPEPKAGLGYPVAPPGLDTPPGFHHLAWMQDGKALDLAARPTVVPPPFRWAAGVGEWRGMESGMAVPAPQGGRISLRLECYAADATKAQALLHGLPPETFDTLLQSP